MNVMKLGSIAFVGALTIAGCAADDVGDEHDDGQVSQGTPAEEDESTVASTEEALSACGWVCATSGRRKGILRLCASPNEGLKVRFMECLLGKKCVASGAAVDILGNRAYHKASCQ